MALGASATAAAAPRCHARRLERWQRIGLGIRLGCHPLRGDPIRVWLLLGRQLARDGALPEPAMLVASLRLLMRSAHDEALPAGWRRICLDHLTRPLARLTTLLTRGEHAGAAEGRALVDGLHRCASALEGGIGTPAAAPRP